VIDADAPVKQGFFDAQHGWPSFGRAALVDFNADDAAEKRVGIAGRRPFEGDPPVVPSKYDSDPATMRTTRGRCTQPYCRRERRKAVAANG